jgi:hypothetical protein
MAKTPLKVVTEARSAERTTLAAAIQRHTEAVRQLGAVKAAQEQASDAVYSARDNIEAATARVEQAKSDAGKFLTKRMLGETNDAPMSVQEARAALTATTDTLEATVAASEALQVQGRAAEQSLGVAELRRDDALRAVVRSDAAVAKLLADFERARREMVNLRLILESLSGLLPENIKSFWRFEPTASEPPGVAAWRAAIEALARDADAALPD